jgi:hypothetical protein
MLLSWLQAKKQFDGFARSFFGMKRIAIPYKKGTSVLRNGARMMYRFINAHYIKYQFLKMFRE